MRHHRLHGAFFGGPAPRGAVAAEYPGASGRASVVQRRGRDAGAGGMAAGSVLGGDQSSPLRNGSAVGGALMAYQYCVTLCKPDAVSRKLVGDILHRFEKRGLDLVDLKFVRMTEQQIRLFYSDKATESFFPDLLAFLLSGPVVAAAWSGEDAIEKGRQVIGEKDPLASAAGT